jgi:carboxymethylenebutenolidase
MQRARAGSEIAYTASAQRRRAYLATPAAGLGRGVLVVHEADGLGDFALDVCDRLAREGFVAFAPDWLGTGSATPADESRRLAAQLDPARAGDALAAAIDALLGREACQGARIGALGFGWGGPLALDLGTRSHRIGAVVACWGAHPRLDPDLEKLTAACLAFVPERDPGAPPGAARALESQLRAKGRRGVVRVVPGAAAGFLDSGRPTEYDAAAAAETWDALIAFLRAELE